MAWKSWIGSESAIHIESGEKFTVNYYSKNVQTIDDFGIVPVPGSGKKRSSEELLCFKQELLDHWENNRRRSKLSGLIKQKFCSENWQAVNAINSVTGKAVSVRSIQTWLIDSEKPSSRKCPAWALKALQDYVDNPENAQNLEEIALYKSKYPKSHLEEIYDSRGLELATHAIEWDQRALDGWQKADFNTLPRKLFELEKRIDSYLAYLNGDLSAVRSALDECDNFDDFKKLVKEKVDAADLIRFDIRTNRELIQNKKGELSNEEGLPG